MIWLTIMYLFLMFWFFSFLGWILEVLSCSITDKRFVNRGFLIGPYCPIYGCGALIMLIISSLSNNLFVIFILAMVLCSALEYFTSFLMEVLFKIRWWDYSNDAFNINGRVCLRNALAFGALGVIFIKILIPWYNSFIGKPSCHTLCIIIVIVFIVTIIDILVSFNAMSKIKGIIDKNLNKFKNVDATEDIKKLISKKIPSINFLHKRLIWTYHLLGKEKEYLKKTIKKVNEKTKSGYGLMLLFSCVGLVIGLILSLYYKLGSAKLIIPFTVSISLLIAFIIMRRGGK